jgi:hypothetical protein
MRTTLSVLCLSTVGLLGCMSSSPGARRVYQEGDATGQPRVEALPSLDIDQSKLTQEMRMARLLSAESLNLDPPVRPRDTSTATIADWSDNELKSWMQSKHQAAEAARKELDVAAVQNHRQRIMAGAMVGLVYEDVARTLLTLPIPAELSSEPEIAAMYVDILRTQAGPYLVQSRQAYAACAGNAAQLPELKHWSEFCLTREEKLPSAGEASAPQEGQGKQGQTTVSVSSR